MTIINENFEKTFFKKQKIRIIQGNNSELPTNKGDFCWSGKKSFSDEKNTIRKTLFIRKNIDNSRDLCVFDSEFDSFRQEDNMYLFKVINTPKVRMNAPTKVHLRSSSKEKLDAIALVEENLK